MRENIADAMAGELFAKLADFPLTAEIPDIPAIPFEPIVIPHPTMLEPHAISAQVMVTVRDSLAG
jgi:hypothetical protein